MDSVYDTLKNNNDFLNVVDPTGWRGRICKSDLAYAKFIDHIKESQRDLDLLTISLELTAVHQILHIDLGVWNNKLTESQEQRCSAVISALKRMDLLNLLTDDAKKKVLKEIKKFSG